MSSAASVVNLVSLADAAVAAGVSRQRLYRTWGSQGEFHDALFCYVSSRALTLSGYDVLGVPQFWSGTDAGMTLRQVMVDQCNRAQGAIADDPGLRFDLVALAFDRPSAAAAARSGAHGRVLGQLKDQLERFARIEGRTFVSPVGSGDIAALIWSLALGLNYLSHFRRFDDLTSSIEIEDGITTSLSVFALGVESLLLHLTRPGATSQRCSETSGRAAAEFDGPPVEWSGEQRWALEAGARLFDDRLANADDSGVSPLGELSLTRLARHAKISRRSVYNLWSSQEAFEEDLNRYVHRQQIADSHVRLARIIETSGSHPNFLLEVCDRMTEWRCHDSRDAQRSFNYAYLRTQRVRSDAMAVDVDAYKEDLRRVLSVYRHQQRLKFAPGVAPSAFGCALTALSVGTKALHLLAPGALRTHLAWRGGVFSAFAIGYQAVADRGLIERAD